MSLSVLELCAGGGGQALGLEMAGFEHAAAVEYEPQFCITLRHNRPHWRVIQQDIRHLRSNDFTGIDLLAAGVPCPPFSVAGKQLGSDDDRDMFPAALQLIEGIRPRAVLLENVPGFASKKFTDYRNVLLSKLRHLGYEPRWSVLQAANFGVPQLRPRFILVALRLSDANRFAWPEPVEKCPTVGPHLHDLMAENGWQGADQWAKKASYIAPTIVGGSKKHGGPDLGPTRAKAQWRQLGVDGMGIANAAPGPEFPIDGFPRLTVRMVARVQGFPDEWLFHGPKTTAYRQVGNALPPPVACAVGNAIRRALGEPIRYTAPKYGVQMQLLDKTQRSKLCPQRKVQKY